MKVGLGQATPRGSSLVRLAPQRGTAWCARVERVERPRPDCNTLSRTPRRKTATAATYLPNIGL